MAESAFRSSQKKSRAADTEQSTTRLNRVRNPVRSPTAIDRRRRSRFGPGSATDQAIACPYQVAHISRTRQWITSFVRVDERA